MVTNETEILVDKILKENVVNVRNNWRKIIQINLAKQEKIINSIGPSALRMGDINIIRYFHY